MKRVSLFVVHLFCNRNDTDTNRKSEEVRFKSSLAYEKFFLTAGGKKQTSGTKPIIYIMAQNKPTATPAAKATEATEVKNEVPATPAAKPEPTSEKLEALKKAKTVSMTEAAKAQMAGNDKEAEDKFLEVYKINEEIKRELATIKQHEQELLRKEKEAVTVKLFDDAVEALRNSDKVAASKAEGELKIYKIEVPNRGY